MAERRRIVGCVLAAATLVGCHAPEPSPTSDRPLPVEPPIVGVARPTTAPTTAPTESDRTVATVNGIIITQSDLYRPLIESYGLTMLQNIMLLKLSQQLVSQVHLTVTPADVQRERAGTLAGLFPDAAPADYPGLLDQFLRAKNLSAVQFDMLVETNANLRKVVAPHLPVFTEDQLRQAFGQQYGENRVVHDIEVPNMADAAEAKRRIAAGQPFEQVAKDMSDDPRTSPQGGELPPFSNQAPNVPAAIKQTVFSMKVGDVSDPVQVGSEFHILRLDGIIPPKVVKFEDVRTSVEKMLQDQWMKLAIDKTRGRLAQVAIQTIHIDDPALAGQWRQMLDRQQNKQRGRDEVRAELSREHASTAMPATQQAPADSTLPSPAGAGNPAAQPPATMPGAAPASAAPGAPAAPSR